MVMLGIIALLEYVFALTDLRVFYGDAWSTGEASRNRRRCKTPSSTKETQL